VAHGALAVADDYHSGEAERTAAFGNFGYAVKGDEFLLEFGI